MFPLLDGIGMLDVAEGFQPWRVSPLELGVRLVRVAPGDEVVRVGALHQGEEVGTRVTAEAS
jgi:hypothetical protein